MIERKHIFSIITVVILALFLIAAPGCGEATGPELEDSGTGEDRVPENGEPETEDPVEEEEQQEDKEAVTDIFRVGDTVIKDKYQVTVNSARWVAEDGPDTPAAGTKWLAIGYSVENKSDIEFNVSRLVNFFLYDAEGESSGIRLLADSDTYDDYLEEGESLYGEIVFIVNEGDHTWEFVFNPDNLVFPNPGLGKASFEIREGDIEQ